MDNSRMRPLADYGMLTKAVCDATENGICRVVCEWKADTWERAGDGALVRKVWNAVFVTHRT